MLNVLGLFAGRGPEWQLVVRLGVARRAQIFGAAVQSHWLDTWHVSRCLDVMWHVATRVPGFQ